MDSATLLRGFEPHFAEIGGVGTRWWVGGTGPPLVLVHGLGGAAFNFTELAPILARSHRVLLPDLPGHGGTAPLPEVAGLGDLARHAALVAEREGMLPAAVLGYSLGGVVALRLAVERPADVSALVLVAPAGIASRTRRARVWLAAVTAIRPARVVARARGIVARRPNLRGAVFGVWGADAARALSPEAVLGFLEAQPEHTDVRSAARALVGDDPRPDLDRVRAPALVLWGARDRLVPLDDGFEYARRLRCPVRVLPGVGHLLVAEDPEGCAAAVSSFLTACAGSSR
ncbi:MAG TPA: alpha/beta fold hydrolase [Gaiellaceae bacterium]|nr:alpha/beta fold hydrolase [Gaiellaceae bacterium]